MSLENLLMSYGIPIIGAAILLLSWQVFFARRKPKGKQADETKSGEEKPPDEPVRVRVYDCDSRMVKNMDIPAEAAKKIKEKFGSLGRQWSRYGVKLYALMLKDGVYSPVPAGASLGDTKGKVISPRVIGRALSIGYSIALFYRTQMPQDKSGNIKQILWWSGILGIIIFLMVKG